MTLDLGFGVEVSLNDDVATSYAVVPTDVDARVALEIITCPCDSGYEMKKRAVNKNKQRLLHRAEDELRYIFYIMSLSCG